jgi:hypothetical protein
MEGFEPDKLLGPHKSAVIAVKYYPQWGWEHSMVPPTGSAWKQIIKDNPCMKAKQC